MSNEDHIKRESISKLMCKRCKNVVRKIFVVYVVMNRKLRDIFIGLWDLMVSICLKDVK